MAQIQYLRSQQEDTENKLVCGVYSLEPHSDVQIFKLNYKISPKLVAIGLLQVNNVTQRPKHGVNS